MNVSLQLLILVCLLGLVRSVAADVKAVWVGQVEKDFVGPSAKKGPSDTQDLQMRLLGLPANKQITNLRIVLRGAGEWQYNGPWGAYAAHIERAAGATEADVYVEPQATRPTQTWDITVTYDDGSTEMTTLEAGPSDRALRMPDAVLTAQWIGQDGRDWTGRRAAVGPDGIQDVVLKINGLSDKHGILNSIRVEADRGPVWEYGHNPDKVWNAEVFRETPQSRTAEMLISPPERAITGRPLKVTVWYGYNRDWSFEGTGTAGRSSPTLRAPLPTVHDVRLIPRFAANWLGQDGADVTGRGDVHVRVAGLPTRSPVVAASLSDDAGGHWVWRASDDVKIYQPRKGKYTQLAFRPTPGNPAGADLHFAPFRDEHNGRMTLRVVLADGSMHFGQFDGQACDPYLRGDLPSDASITAKPGDDLHALVKQHGAIRLAPGVYPLSQPLTLEQPVTISGPRDAVLVFRQPATDEPWNQAIQIAADNVTLDGFSLRFDGQVRWAMNDGSRGCGVILAHPRTSPTSELVNLTVRNMDIEGSDLGPVEDPAKPQWIPDLIRTGRVLSGHIIGNILRGGHVDVSFGPWVVSDNTHLGAPAGGMTWDAFAAHYVHDLTLERNKVHADASPGKIWRFLVLTQQATRTIVRDNDIRGVGKRDDDPMPNPNAPEIFLTEAYRLHYEGEPVGVAAGGHVIQIPFAMWGEPRPGSVVAILDGEHAGEWFKIAQPIDRETYILDRPMPRGRYAISVTTGLLDELYENNTFDVRGGNSDVIQLCGTAFNTIVRNNHVKGGRLVLLKAPPTEFPGVWGWSLCPIFDLVFEGNTLEDMRGGLVLETHHDRRNTKSVPGRLYQTMVARDNTILWTAEFARWHAANAISNEARKSPFWVPLQAITLGSADSPAPTDLRVVLESNRATSPPSLRDAAIVFVHKAVVNRRPLTDQKLPLQTTVSDAEARTE